MVDLAGVEPASRTPFNLLHTVLNFIYLLRFRRCALAARLAIVLTDLARGLEGVNLRIAILFSKS